MHEVLVNRLGGLSLPRKSVVRLTDRPDMTLDVHRGRKTTIQQKKVGKSKYIYAAANEKDTCVAQSLIPDQTALRRRLIFADYPDKVCYGR